MRTTTGRLLQARAAILTALALAATAEAQIEGRVMCDLLAGSVIVDACDNCGRKPVTRALTGSFVLEFDSMLIGATVYNMTEIAFTDAGGFYTVTGGGKYRQLTTFPMVQALDLQLTVNDAAGVKCESSGDVVLGELPLLVVGGTEPTIRDPAHIYTFHLVAAPRPIGWVPYILLEGSTLTADCGDCGQPPVTVPLAGTFLFGDVDSIGSMELRYFVIAALNAQSTDGTGEHALAGEGIYEWVTDVERMQEGSLVATIGGSTGTLVLESSTLTAAWPTIDFTAKSPRPFGDGFTYTLRLLANFDSGVDPLFLRGDANVDGKTNIADAIFTLGYLFAHGPAPQCEDAADANDDGTLNIADAIAVLSHLFAHAGPLPEPFTTCGNDPIVDVLDCAAFSPCL